MVSEYNKIFHAQQNPGQQQQQNIHCETFLNLAEINDTALIGVHDVGRKENDLVNLPKKYKTNF